MAADASLRQTLASLAPILSGDARYAAFLGSFLLVAALEVAGVGLLPAFIAALGDPAALRALPGVARVAPPPEAGDVALVTWAGALVAAFFLAKNLLLAAVAWFQAGFVASRQAALSTRLLAAYLHQPYPFHLRRNSAELIRNTTGVTFSVFSGVVVPGCVVLTESLVIALVAALLLAVSPLATLAALVLIGGVSLAFYAGLRARLRRLGERQQGEATAMIKWVSQGLGGIKEAIILGRERFFVDSYARHIEAYSRSAALFQSIGALPRLFLEVVVVGGLVAVVLVLARSGASIQAVFPTLVLFGVAALRLMPSVTRIVGSLTMVRFNQHAVETVARDLAADAPRARRLTAARLPLAEAIEAKDLGYTYEGGARPALAGVNLRIPRGAMAAFVGRSGAGKSTLVDLLIGLHPPSTGSVRVDGRDIADNVRGWQENIGYVPQTIFLTDDSVRRNVAFGLDDAEIDDARVRQALDAAQLGAFVAGLPQGLDTVLGERGARLSGGQRQRVGIARALYRDPEVLVLDEATAALDRPTAEEVGAVLAALAGKKTILMIAHQMSSVRLCQQVFLLQDGALAAAGSFDELAAAHPGFQALVE